LCWFQPKARGHRIVESHPSTIAISYLNCVTVAEAVRQANEPPGAGRNNPVTNEWELALRFASRFFFRRMGEDLAAKT
jgi:hypothetical protein